MQYLDVQLRMRMQFSGVRSLSSKGTTQHTQMQSGRGPCPRCRGSEGCFLLKLEAGTGSLTAFGKKELSSTDLIKFWS